MNKVEKIIERMKQACHASNDSQLVKKLNISTSSVTHWRTRGTIPYEECSKIALSFDVSLDWLIHGNRELDTKKEELVEAWKSRKSGVDNARAMELKDALSETVTKGTTVETVVEWALELYDFETAKDYKDFLTILTANN